MLVIAAELGFPSSWTTLAVARAAVAAVVADASGGSGFGRAAAAMIAPAHVRAMMTGRSTPQQLYVVPALLIAAGGTAQHRTAAARSTTTTMTTGCQ